MEVDAMNSKKKISSENTLNIEKISNISHYVIIKEDILYKLVYRHSTNFPFFFYLQTVLLISSIYS